MLIGSAILAIVFAVSFAGVGFYRRWSERNGIVDIPNERSSHASPTPRGGGLVIAGVCLAGYLAIALITGSRCSWGYVTGCLIVVAVSWLDDLRSVSSAVRLACHAVAALIFIVDTGFLASVEIPGMASDLSFGYIAPFITFLWIVWVINAYNFMDGIDGIAGTQALVAAIGWALISYTTHAFSTYYFALIITAAAAGFLVHNWQPARLFMGDTGSAYLGFTVAVIPVLAASESPASSGRFALTGVIVLWFFLFDSLLTFFRRAIAGERVWTAHREHIYQRMVLSGRSHAFVSLLYGMCSILVIAAFAFGMMVNGKASVIVLLVLGAVSAALPFFRLSKNMLT